MLVLHRPEPPPGLLGPMPVTRESPLPSAGEIWGEGEGQAPQTPSTSTFLTGLWASGFLGFLDRRQVSNLFQSWRGEFPPWLTTPALKQASPSFACAGTNRVWYVVTSR